MGIQIKNIFAEWKDFQLRNVYLSINDNEYFVILGPSGSGKTLLLECIAGFHALKRGQILINENDVTKLPPEKRNVGFVYEEYSLFPHMNVEENIGFSLQFKDLSKTEKREQIKKFLRLLEIEHLQGRNVRTLSSGERQRVSMARALIMNPDVLLLDEPLSALDAPRRREFTKVLKHLHDELTTTTIHVTHDQRIAASLANRIGVIRDGQILEVGPIEEIFSRPRNLFTANFLGFENTFKGKATLQQGLASVKVQNIEILSTTAASGEVYISIRPEDIIVSKEKFRSSAKNTFSGTIQTTIDQGSTVKLEVQVGEALTFSVLITKRSLTDLSLQKGKKVYLSFKATTVRLFQGNKENL
ncbi:MAG: ABC transporter ATP-binding protein [Candidatus Korarchaeota archaeon]|nr:ABC transporter ATP-binding protein [Candidatus Korarchaeota archaeon]NIU84500.1 ATP-binding cassette domain-containing protein [Candidatus Thorarchaeota archaeon]NIW14567.1 ATP-binding cassette domain-containing protein [Candidatus Thorarchaeota archaeon]NIW52639.1 ATP-binding cassette domain-containing protein [Candidatus Korarchaeota archaeon]